jgi:aminodeoxyfutalosine synthase
LETDFTGVSPLAELEPLAADGKALTPEQIARVAECRDLPAVGLLGELARKAKHGNRVTFVRVAQVRAGHSASGGGPSETSEAGEVRLIGAPESIDQARAWVREAVRRSAGVPVTGFSLVDFRRLGDGKLARIAEHAAALREEGLASVAEVPLDEVGELREAVELLETVSRAGLPAWRATITRGGFAERMTLVDFAAAIQRETGAFKAFAALPRVDPADQPSTGYDDVRAVALARLVCSDIPFIQVDWTLYGPKLAQVAIAFGADDLDNVPSASRADLGHRRSTRAEIERHIRMAFADPVERDGRFEMRG